MTLINVQKNFINYFINKYNLNNDFLNYQCTIHKRNDMCFTNDNIDVFVNINTNHISICYRYKYFYKRYNLSDSSMTIKIYNRKDVYELHGINFAYKKIKFYWLGEKLA